MKKQAKIFLALTLWLGALYCNAATKQDATQSNAIKAQNFYAFPTIDGVDSSAAFGTLSNESEQPIALQKVTIVNSTATAELHQTIEEKGMVKMLPVDSIAIPAKQSVELAPGGLHIMLINLPKPLKVSKTISLELAFDDGTILKLDAPIKERNSSKSGKHAHH